MEIYESEHKQHLLQIITIIQIYMFLLTIKMKQK